MTPDTPPPDRPSSGPSPRISRITRSLAIIGLISLFAGSTIVLKTFGVINWSIGDILSDSDEAPIRVRNGSIEIRLLSTTQKWNGNAGEYGIPGAHRQKEEFDVTVTARNGAVCPATVGTGQDVILTYSDNTTVRFKSAGKHTKIKGENGATLTWNASAPQILLYTRDGFIRSIAVGQGANPPTMCSFTAADQVVRIDILNAP